MRRYRAHFPVIAAIALVSLSLYFTSDVARAEIYKWVDADGEVHYLGVGGPVAAAGPSRDYARTGFSGTPQIPESGSDPVPEPATLLLLAGGALLLRRRHLVAQ